MNDRDRDGWAKSLVLVMCAVAVLYCVVLNRLDTRLDELAAAVAKTERVLEGMRR